MVAQGRLEVALAVASYNGRRPAIKPLVPINSKVLLEANYVLFYAKGLCLWVAKGLVMDG